MMGRIGGDRGTQTLDFFHAMEALYQLSYIPEYHQNSKDPLLFLGTDLLAAARPPGALLFVLYVYFKRKRVTPICAPALR